MPRRARKRTALATVQRLARKRRGGRPSAERRLIEELGGLARLIRAAKRDIAALRRDEIRQKHLPTATDELDAIVAATAEATGAILDAAERLSAVAESPGEDASARILDQVTRIFEACTFQDITGQRITKVVKTLKEIDAKVGALVDAFGPARRGRAAKPTVSEAGSPDESALLNGPQLPQAAASQSDIDALFDKV